MAEFDDIIKEIDTGECKPIYLLGGEEAYFIDTLADKFATQLLNEAERGFDQTVVYGRDTTVLDIVGMAKRYPMIASKQLVLVKEGQHLSRQMDKLLGYVENPQPSTVLVICYKDKKLDKRGKLYKAIKKNGRYLESKRLYENQVGPWLTRYISTKGYSIDQKTVAIVIESIGTNLSRFEKEMEKLFLVLKPGSKIMADDVQTYIGISKDYNNFELKKAIGAKDFKKSSKILGHFAQNPKEHPLVMVLATLQSFFSNLLLFHGMSDRSPNNVSKLLGINPYFIGEYELAAKKYEMKKVSRIISKLRELDLKGKGLGSQNLSQSDLLKELLLVFY